VHVFAQPRIHEPRKPVGSLLWASVIPADVQRTELLWGYPQRCKTPELASVLLDLNVSVATP